MALRRILVGGPDFRLWALLVRQLQLVQLIAGLT